MAMFGNVGRVFGTRTDVRAVVDPWNLGYTLGVRRADGERFMLFGGKDERLSPLLEATGRAILKLKMAETLIGADIVRPGFRTPRKATASEVADRADRFDPAQVIEDTAAAVDVTRLFQTVATTQERNVLKQGVAQHLIDWWEGAKDDVTGEPVPCTLPNRLYFLGWDGVLVLEQQHDEALDRGIHYLTHQQHRDMDAASDLAGLVASGAARVHVFTGNPRNAGGDYYEIPAGAPYGPALVGDGLTNWVLAEAKLGAEYAQAQQKEDAEGLGGTPAGELGPSTT